MSKLIKSSNDKGFSLIAVTWLVLIVSLIASSVLVLGLTFRHTVSTLEEGEKRQLLAESALNIFMLRYFYDDERHEYRNARFNIGDSEVTVNVGYESGKIDLNRAQVHVLSAVFASKGLNQVMSVDIARRIVDWRDLDALTFEGGQENDVYEGTTVTSGPRNGAFESVAELQYIPDISVDVYNCILPELTIYSTNIEPNLLLAPDEVKATYRWARANNWQAYSWSDPDEREDLGGTLDADANIVGQVIKVTITLEDFDRNYSTYLRFTSSAEQQLIFQRLTPFRAAFLESTERKCSL